MGRFLLDAVTEAILNVIVFMFMFAGWCVRWSLATILFVAVMAGAGYYVFFELLQGGSYVEVPDVTMRPITEASFVLAQRGLELGKQSHVADDRVPKYYVIAQRPAAGKVVRTGRRVYLSVSAGTESLSPPSLVGKLLQKADEDLRLTSFSLGAVARIAHNSPRDTVIAQDPTSERLVSADTRINLLVSEGRPSRPYIMPDILDKPVQEAMTILAPMSLKLVPNNVDLPDQPRDVVLDQSPPAGSLVREGDRVVYTVCPSGTVALPNAQRSVAVPFILPETWFEREVRVDTIDRKGVRTTVFPLERDFVDGRPPRFSSGQKPLENKRFSFVDKMTVEIYLDGQVVQSYYYEGDAEPVVTKYNVQ